MTSLTGDGATQTIFIFQIEGVIGYKINQSDFSELTWPVTITNVNPLSSVLKVFFDTDLTFTSSSQYFNPNSSGIQIGNDSLRDGALTTITIDGVSYYPGLINSTEYSIFNSIYIYNINIHASNDSTMGTGSGWIMNSDFGFNGSDIWIVNCHSDGSIPNEGGGIIGTNTFIINADTLEGRIPSLNIIGCSSKGDIGSNAGGIIGSNAGRNDGGVMDPSFELNIKGCWSEGAIGANAGGIFGSRAGANNTDPDNYISITAEDCYSTGEIYGEVAGGIFGFSSFRSVARNCYSLGAVFGADAGSIFGSDASYSTAANCYSTGSVSNVGSGGGIFGFAATNLTAENCYTSGVDSYISPDMLGTEEDHPTCYSEAVHGNSGWNTTHASTVLRRIFPQQDAVWVSPSDGVPFELFFKGKTPYTNNVINSDTNGFVTNFEMVLNAGETSDPAIVADKDYSLIQPHSGITINSSTGAITVASDVPDGIYTLFVRYTGSYHYSTVGLTVGLGTPGPSPSPSPCCPSTTELKGKEFNTRYDVKRGVLIRQGSHYGPLAYSDLMKIRKANAFVR